MKILLLNPRIDAAHEIYKNLTSMGVAVLLPADIAEAMQLMQLHGTSIDLAVIHREGVEAGTKAIADPGVGLIQKIKAMPENADLPIILSSEKWKDSDFATHQATPEGANGYLKWPYSETQLGEYLEAILGVSLGLSEKAVPPGPVGIQAAAVQFEPEHDGGTVLQDLGEVLKEPTPDQSIPSIGIKFEAADLGESVPAAVPAGSPNAQPGPSFPSLSPALEPPSSITASSPEESAKPAIPASLADLLAPAVESTEDQVAVEAKPAIPASLADLLAPSEPSKPAFETPAQAPSVELPTGGMSLEELSLTNLKQTQPSEAAPSSGIPEEIPEQIPEGATSFSLSGLAPSPRVQDEPEPQSPSEDVQAIQEMPYIFGKRPGSQEPRQSPMLAEAMGDAIIPGGVSQNPDLETIKKYLFLREQDVAVLSTQLKAMHNQVQALELTLREEKARTAELNHVANEQKQKIDDFEKEKAVLISKFEAEMQDLNFQVKAKMDRAKLFESKIEASSEEMEHLKERVRIDIRKIRVREKELENRLEIMKKDSEALVGARESRIIELKRKLDLLEFNMDLLQDQYTREKEKTADLRERLGKAAQIVRVAEGLLESSKITSGESGGASGSGNADHANQANQANQAEDDNPAKSA